MFSTIPTLALCFSSLHRPEARPKYRKELLFSQDSLPIGDATRRRPRTPSSSACAEGTTAARTIPPASPTRCPTSTASATLRTARAGHTRRPGWSVRAMGGGEGREDGADGMAAGPIAVAWSARTENQNLVASSLHVFARLALLLRPGRPTLRDAVPCAQVRARVRRTRCVWCRRVSWISRPTSTGTRIRTAGSSSSPRATHASRRRPARLSQHGYPHRKSVLHPLVACTRVRCKVMFGFLPPVRQSRWLYGQ